MDLEIKKILDKHEERLKKLENFLFKHDKNIEVSTSKLKGIPKGVQEVISVGFFDTPKSVKQTKEELEKKGHFGSLQRIDTVIRRDFFKRKGVLTRVKEGNSWNYVIKK